MKKKKQTKERVFCLVFSTVVFDTICSFFAQLLKRTANLFSCRCSAIKNKSATDGV